MRRIHQWLLGSTGVVVIAISLLHIVLGPACIPGAPAVTATMDSEDRFFAVFFLAYGAALLWCVRDVQRKGPQVRLLALLFFLGGVTRLVSIAAVGLPHPLFRALTPVELGLPLIWLWLQKSVEFSAQSVSRARVRVT